jgi:hypothetical protein
MTLDEELDEESWDIRETFAYFGRAFYMASVLEVGLAHALMHGEFMIQERKKFAARMGIGFDRKQYEADFDAYLDKQFAQTMGNIIQRVELLPYFDKDLKERLAEAKARRNFLTHRYWRERSVNFATAKGRAEMRAELQKDAETFGQLDREIEAVMQPARKILGIDDDMLEAHTKRMIQKMKDGLPWEVE